MRVGTCCLLLMGLIAGPAMAQEIPDRALPSLKAAPKLPANLKKKKASAKAPTVVRRATWWTKRSGLSQKLLAAGGLSVLGGTALVAVGASMANNAIDRRSALQNKETLTDVERAEFTDQSGSVETGTSLHLSGLILCGAGALAAGLGGVL
jgi:hypothetical protein